MPTSNLALPNQAGLARGVAQNPNPNQFLANFKSGTLGLRQMASGALSRFGGPAPLAVSRPSTALARPAVEPPPSLKETGKKMVLPGLSCLGSSALNATDIGRSLPVSPSTIITVICAIIVGAPHKMKALRRGAARLGTGSAYSTLADWGTNVPGLLSKLVASGRQAEQTAGVEGVDAPAEQSPAHQG